MRYLRNLIRRPVRTALTIVGITIGIWALVVFGSMANKINALVAGGSTYYADKITVADGSGQLGGFASAPMSLTTADKIRSVDGVNVVVPAVMMLMDDQATQIYGITDAIAERVRKTGNTTLRSIGDVARRQRIRDNDKEFVSAAEMISELRGDNLALVEALREAKAIVDDARDNATSGMLDGWTDQAEERAWFLFEASRTG